LTAQYSLLGALTPSERSGSNADRPQCAPEILQNCCGICRISGGIPGNSSGNLRASLADRAGFVLGVPYIPCCLLLGKLPCSPPRGTTKATQGGRLRRLPCRVQLSAGEESRGDADAHGSRSLWRKAVGGWGRWGVGAVTLPRMCLPTVTVTLKVTVTGCHHRFSTPKGIPHISTNWTSDDVGEEGVAVSVPRRAFLIFPPLATAGGSSKGWFQYPEGHSSYFHLEFCADGVCRYSVFQYPEGHSSYFHLVGYTYPT